MSTINPSSSVYEILSLHPTVAQCLPLDKLTAVIVILRHLKDRIKLNSPVHIPDPPIALPISIHQFLCDALEIPEELAKVSWIALKEYIWVTDNKVNEIMPYADVFLQYGGRYEIGKLPSERPTSLSNVFARFT